ncbi:FAD-dependent thymidylate synthase [Clostridium sp. AF32-12BH]|uniref:FAD-dependent thymidylate synthase n=1 Tax=Clostridium sp. AF32-12BH TaxID=2292006 RepID=UPI000E53C526|nr:FAD-dependent thymidylate synthase [Clostridium sp. AF32-12BH]RHP46896.1 FAD-dependent thymidylate synthase [Clostridium sp. AF32-12BH]
MGTITILPETPKDPLALIGRRAGICWNANITDEERNIKRGKECIESGHGRTMEFVDVHMVIDGYSARVMREYYRHVGGMTPYLQASTRYINYKDFEIIRPASIEKNKEALVAFNTAAKNLRDSLEELKNCGVPNEDVANLLPLGMTTKTVEKRNLRNLVDMSHVRLCSRAYHEYRLELFPDIMNALREYSDQWEWIVDNLFKPKCEVYGFCDEKKSCGRKPRKESANA